MPITHTSLFLSISWPLLRRTTMSTTFILNSTSSKHSSVLSLLGILPDKPTRLHACMLILCYVSNFKQWYSQTTWESSKPFLGTRDGIIHWIIIGLKPRVGQTQRNGNDQRSKKIWIQILLFYFPNGWCDLGCDLVCESFIFLFVNTELHVYRAIVKTAWDTLHKVLSTSPAQVSTP